LHGIDVNAERVCAAMVDKIKNGRLADLAESQTIDPVFLRASSGIRAEQENTCRLRK